MSRAVQTRIAALVVALLLQPVAASAESLLCRDGHRQSPIDIVAPVKTAAPALEFDYRPAPLRIANDGHTLRVRFANDSRLLIGKAA